MRIMECSECGGEGTTNHEPGCSRPGLFRRVALPIMWLGEKEPDVGMLQPICDECRGHRGEHFPGCSTLGSRWNPQGHGEQELAEGVGALPSGLKTAVREPSRLDDLKRLEDLVAGLNGVIGRLRAGNADVTFSASAGRDDPLGWRLRVSVGYAVDARKED